jgi:hypothetical protein
VFEKTSLVMKVVLRLAHGRKKVSTPDDLPAEPLESVPTDSASNLTASPTQTADLSGVVSWVLASVSILVGFVIIAGATGVDREEANNRRVNSFIPQQTKMVRSQSEPIPRYSPTKIVDDFIHGEHKQNTASASQQSASRDEEDTLDGKEVRRALPVDVRTSIPGQPMTPKRAE